MADQPRPATRPERSSPAGGAWRTYLELASGLGEVSRKQVRKVLKDLVGKGNATAEQLRTLTSELVVANAANREALGKLIKVEVDRALGRVGLATMDEVNDLTARVRELERELRQARGVESFAATGRTVAPTPAAARTSTKAAPTTAGAPRRPSTTAPAKKTVAKKAVAKKAVAATTPAPARKTVAKKTVAKKAVAKKAVAKKTTGTRGGQQ
jgi:polyhydroxyalkanoate synthesis regulator phasin